MLARALSATPWGVDARPVQVEVDVRNGLPQVQIVGLAHAAVRESRELRQRFERLVASASGLRAADQELMARLTTLADASSAARTELDQLRATLIGSP